ncbi:MAG TPA: T9SS type A sorting domain-containing protein [Bacteroidia bacterium]|jgi:hypothetical protein|nr:T9SS type A sorting domain-containing protein [Bacteroidia bacterium]
MNKRLLSTACMLIILSGYSQESSMAPAGIPEYQTKELLTDTHLKRGFIDIVNGVKVTDPAHIMGCPPSNPVWNAAEWKSQFYFSSQTGNSVNGWCTYSSSYKDFRFGGPLNSRDYDVYMAVNSEAEFSSHFRKLIDTVQNWPALYLEQRVTQAPAEPTEGPGCPPLSKLNSLTFKIDAKLLYNQTYTQQISSDSSDPTAQHYNSNIHASSFQVFLTVQKLNSSVNYGTKMWFGIPLYDNRQRSIKAYKSLDGNGGSNDYIFSLASTDFTTQSLQDGNWVSINFNVLPKVIDGLNEAIHAGYLTGTINDYMIGAVLIGWENTGRNVSTVVFRNVSLVAQTNQLYWGLQRPSNGADTQTPVVIFPNPAVENVISFSGNNIQAVSIVDCLGREVIQYENSTNGNEPVKIDISQLPKGIYFSFVKTENGIEKTKILRQ